MAKTGSLSGDEMAVSSAKVNGCSGRSEKVSCVNCIEEGCKNTPLWDSGKNRIYGRKGNAFGNQEVVISKV